MRAAHVLVALSTGFVLLAGCTAPATTAPATSAPATSAPATSAPAAGGSLIEECAELSAQMSTAAATMQSAMADLSTDPDKAVSAMQEFAESFEAAAAKVTNPELKAQADKAVAALGEMIDGLKAIIKDPSKAADLTETMTKFQEETTAIGAVCGG